MKRQAGSVQRLRSLLAIIIAAGAIQLITWVTVAAEEGLRIQSPEAGDAFAPRAVLFEQEGLAGVSFSSPVKWRTAPIEGKPGGVEAQADIDIPAIFKLTLALRKNSDETIPASHILELAFHSVRSFEESRVDDVLGVKMGLADPGGILVGKIVKVSDETFVIRLSGSDAERTTNLILLRSMPKLDISIAYRNSRQAVLSIEKGLPGSAAVLAALETPSLTAVANPSSSQKKNRRTCGSRRKHAC